MTGDNIHDILNEDEVKRSVDELVEQVAHNFDSLDAVVIIWADTDDNVNVRLYGTPTTLSGILARSQHKVMREEEIG